MTRAHERPGGSLVVPSRRPEAADWRDNSSSSTLLRNVFSSGFEKWKSCKKVSCQLLCKTHGGLLKEDIFFTIWSSFAWSSHHEAHLYSTLGTADCLTVVWEEVEPLVWVDHQLRARSALRQGIRNGANILGLLGIHHDYWLGAFGILCNIFWVVREVGVLGVYMETWACARMTRTICSLPWVCLRSRGRQRRCRRSTLFPRWAGFRPTAWDIAGFCTAASRSTPPGSPCRLQTSSTSAPQTSPEGIIPWSCCLFVQNPMKILYCKFTGMQEVVCWRGERKKVPSIKGYLDTSQSFLF